MKRGKSRGREEVGAGGKKILRTLKSGSFLEKRQGERRVGKRRRDLRRC